MTGALQLALAVGPLAVYLYVVAIWQSGRHPRVVAGVWDYVLLLFGVGGLVLFGPLGWLLVTQAAPGRPTVLHWLALASALGLLAVPFLPRAFRRIVIYNIDPATLDSALRETLESIAGSFVKTVRGYDDASQRRGLDLEIHPWMRTAVVETHGNGAEPLAKTLLHGLDERLRQSATGPSRIAWGLLGVSLSLIAPVVVLLLLRPQAQAVWRAVMHRLNGG
jgi:hypothetical protein